MSSTSHPARSALAVRPWRRHLRRALGEEINELARPLDRAHSRALLLAVLGIALAGLLGAGASYADLASTQRHAIVTAAHLHHIEAVLLTPARRTVTSLSVGANSYQAEATWTYPPGQRNTGTIDVSGARTPGSSNRIWVGDGGQLASAPPSTADLTADAVCVGLFTLGGLSLVIATGLGRRLNTLGRQADQAWQHAWERAEPVWTGRTSHKPRTDDTQRG
ncbi:MULTISPECIES: hypothetical protein [unclassified Kitasatospora]|uniref:Rv1733c family protein n=1 Tax=unclassified Kitasatospora TaxID=2633591 RepID=UPI0034063C20